MRKISVIFYSAIIAIVFGTACNNSTGQSNEQDKDILKTVVTEVNNSGDDYLLSVASDEGCKYVDKAGKDIIPEGKYLMCFTDTFRTYAIVLNPEKGFIGIDRKENTLYEVFVYDNGPDFIEEGLFRIVKDGKIGYAEAKTGNIVIAPQFGGAYPFEGGKAKVAVECKTIKDDEHTSWQSDKWYFIDKSGNKIN